MAPKLHVRKLSLLCIVSILGIFSGCHKKFPADSSLLSVPTTEQIGTVYARENVLKGLMVGHEQSWSESAQYFEKAYQSDQHPTIVQLHEQVQQASKSVHDLSEDP